MKFDETVLPNGLRVYSKPWPSARYTTFDVVFPVGHRHNTGDILPGSFHFLEHLCCRRSQAVPEADGLIARLTAMGARANAGTSATNTRYYLSIATERAPEAISLLLQHLQSVIIADQDVVTETAIITSELARKSIYYPGDNRYEHYKATGWYANNSLSLRQVMGSPEDFSRMSAPYFNNLLESYFTEGMVIYVGGSFDLEAILHQVAQIKTTRHDLPVAVPMELWSRREYHVAPCLEEPQFVYHFGGYIPPGDFQLDMTQLFLFSLLGNPASGPLYQWLRKERECVYSIAFGLDRTAPPQPQSWALYVPMADVRHVEPIRYELRKRIEDALADQKLVAIEAKRQISDLVFGAEKLRDAIVSSVQNRVLYGYIPSMEAAEAAIEACANPTTLFDHYAKYWSEEVTGEFLATPLEG